MYFPDVGMFPIFVLSGLLLGLAGILIGGAVKSAIDCYHDHNTTPPKSQQWKLALEVSQYALPQQLLTMYHREVVTPDGVVISANPLPREAKIFGRYDEAREALLSWTYNKNNCRNKLYGQAYHGLTIKLLEKRSYFGIKAWHCIHKGYPVNE